MSEPADRQARIARTIALLCEATAIVALLFTVVDGALRTAGDPRREQVRWTLAGIAAGLLMLRRMADRLDARLALAGFTLLASAAVALTAFSSIDIDRLSRARTAVRGAIGGWYEPTEIYRLDERLGVVHVPNSRAVHTSAEFSVTYSIGSDGWRAMPAMPQEPAAVAIIGDSFTFGWGVEDDEHYPALLAAGEWRGRRIVNAALSGWGLTQFYVTLLDVLEADQPPRAVFVGVISDDLKRSHLRPGYPAGVPRRLEFIGGMLVPTTLQAGPEPEETADLLQQEAELARETLAAMARACSERGVSLTVVLLDDRVSGPFPSSLPYALGGAGIRMLDLTRLPIERHGKDLHPSAAGHRAIAQAIASAGR